jgi:hypothetical protein
MAQRLSPIPQAQPLGSDGVTTPELIRAIGEALFGTRWQTDLGDHLGVNRRTVQRWLTGQDEPRPGVWADLLKVLDERTRAALKLRRVIRERGKATQLLGSAERAHSR